MPNWRPLAISTGVFAVYVAQAPVGLAAETHVYRCAIEGRVTFSDRPCPGTVASEEVSVTAANTYSVPDSARRTPDPPASRESSRDNSGPTSESIAADRQRAKQACARLAEQLEAVQEKLRSGYSIKEDKRLHDRKRDLEERLRGRCR